MTKLIRKIFTTNRKWMGYTIYAVLLMLILMIFRFPSEAIKDYVLTAVNGGNSNISVTIEKASFSFPLRIKFTEVECRLKDDPATTLFKTKEMLVKPSIWSLLTKNQTFRFNCDAYEGSITGSINLQKSGDSMKFITSAELKNIIIDDKSQLPALLKNYIGGTLEGTVKYSGSGLGNTGSEGEASLTLSKGSIKLATPLFNINSIDFKQILIKADLKDQTLNIPNLSLKGDNFLSQATGSVSLKNPVIKSLINLSATVEPTAGSIRKSADGVDAMALLRQSLKNGKISFTLQGTFDQPVFRLKQ
jgi:type II secretion system protein N